ncbi:MAG: GtrA family protein [Candidatus Limiplasma sp.]|nr:GtrA family protein [Candidatus Limiplasma sp.]
MLRKIKGYLDSHPKEYELLRYLIAGGLTTLLSLAVYALFCIAVSADHTVEGATRLQANIGQVLSWIIAVLFAFWINRRMVFQVQGGSPAGILKELLQFMASRLVSLVLFEIALFNLLLSLGLSKMMSKVVGQVFVVVFNYVVSKFWIFVQKKQGPAATPQQAASPQEPRD